MKMSAETSAGGTGGKATKQHSRYRPSSTTAILISRQPKFEGHSNAPDLKGHIYDCANSWQADLFIWTTNAIVEHVRCKHQYRGDVQLAIWMLELSTVSLPPDPKPTATQAQQQIWEKKMDDFACQETWLEKNLLYLYSLVWGQCTELMQQKLLGMKEF